MPRKRSGCRGRRGVFGRRRRWNASEQYTRVRQVDIGAATLRDQSFSLFPCRRHVEQGAKSRWRAFGVELFERFAVELNYGGQTLTVRPLQGVLLGHGVRMRLPFPDDQPIFS